MRKVPPAVDVVAVIVDVVENYGVASVLKEAFNQKPDKLMHVGHLRRHVGDTNRNFIAETALALSVNTPWRFGSLETVCLR